MGDPFRSRYSLPVEVQPGASAEERETKRERAKEQLLDSLCSDCGCALATLPEHFLIEWQEYRPLLDQSSDPAGQWLDVGWWRASPRERRP